jgi:hypothetical protein
MLPFGGATPAFLATLVKVCDEPARLLCCASLQAKRRSSKKLRHRYSKGSGHIDEAESLQTTPDGNWSQLYWRPSREPGLMEQ